MQKIKILSWNVRGMNSPQKRRKIFQYLGKHRPDIVCIQETHINEKDIRFLKNKKLGNEFISASSQRKRGVAIYVNDKYKVKTLFADKDGRYIGVEVNFLEDKYMVVGLYAPIEKKDPFFVKLNKELSAYNYEKTLIMGDWNGVICPELDRKSEKKIKKSQGRLPKSFENLVEEQVLIDVWRFKYKNAKEFTYFSERHQSLSRIDMFMATKHLCKDILKMDCHPRTISDHNPIEIILKKKQKEFAWRLNTSILQKEEILEKGKEILKFYFKENLKEETEITTVWEASKAVIRGFFIQQSIILRKKKRARIEKLYKELRQKEKELSELNKSKTTEKEIKTLKKQIEFEENEELQSKLKFMKQRFFEQANKPGRWLAHKIKKHKERNIITEIRTKDAKLTMDQTKIKEEFQKFYTKLYKGQQISKQKIANFIKKTDLKPFTEQQRNLLNAPITTSEITEIIKRSKKGKSPGPDGLPIEYYQKFEDQLTPHLKSTFNAIGISKFPDTWKQANIALLLKEEKDPTDTRNYRPISLLNVDYKIFSNLLADRLKKILKDWIQEDQAGFLPHRHLKDNIRYIIDVLEYFEDHNEKKLALVFMDLEKAFDNVSWDILQNMLEMMEAGQKYCGWVREIYTDQKARLIVNYERTEEFKISKGTRQGCPLSPLLFIFILEALNNRIRIDENIRGVRIKKYEYKLRSFADDLVFVLEDPSYSMKALIDTLLDFELISGLKVNKDKTTMITKNMSRREEQVLEQISGYKVDKKVKYLGITLTNKSTDLYHNNYKKVWNTVKKDLARWEKLQLSLLGKISVIQMNVLPKLLFLFQTIPILHSFKPLKIWQTEISRFVWNNKKARINMKIMCDSKTRGGLSLPNLKAYYFASALNFISDWILLKDERLLNLEGGNMRYGWHGYVFYDKDKIHRDFKSHVIKKALMNVWNKLKPRLCMKIPLWCSPHEAFFGKEKIPKQNWIRYSDLIKETQDDIEMKSQEELKDSGIYCHWYLFRQLRERWRMDKKLVGIQKKRSDWEENTLKGKKKLISRYYKMIMDWETEDEIIRHSMVRWAQNIGHNLEYKKWENIWTRSIKHTVCQELKENVYKMIYRWHLSPQKLSFMYKNSNPQCWKCLDNVGSYFHIWWTCNIAKKFWLEIHKIINVNMNIKVSFSPEIFLLGMLDDTLEKQHGKFLFYCFSCARIVYAKFWKKPQAPSIDKWLCKLYEMAEMDKLTCWMKDKTEDCVYQEWEEFYKFLETRWNKVLITKKT